MCLFDKTVCEIGHLIRKVSGDWYRIDCIEDAFGSGQNFIKI